ncbi:ASXH domain-containing protein [Fimicolochytrium jonesii]|uniref:ASXH domain-containing protein n=1 Tax=Fimicolochytrium jonesii TaxID=1396493 RepID=UPI0022FDDC8B|nr:ASXH domain-containing protein [Fimicolochytrium jonesii]KAI8824839.1 Asx homology domain-containing protein [Fimicolochytrium jonesii]
MPNMPTPPTPTKPSSDTDYNPTPRRSTRKRPTSPPPPPISSTTPTRRPKRARIQIDSNTSIETLLTSKKSRLGSEGCDLMKCFTYDIFQMFTPAEQSSLASLVPSIDLAQSPPSSLSTTLPERFFNHNRHLRESVHEFQANLGNGFYEPQEWEAMVRGREGSRREFDEWKEQHYEEVWGEQLDQDEAGDEVASLAKTITLKDMCKAGVIRKADRLLYKKNFGGSLNISVEKTVTITSIHPTTQTLTIRSARLTWADITNPTRLETYILDQDGRVAKSRRPNGNAWKSMVLVRGAREVGRLAELREAVARGRLRVRE